jgi:hypothetical protein
MVFYETDERTDVFSELFAELFVAAMTPFFHPDTDYDDYSAGSIFESANINIPMDILPKREAIDCVLPSLVINLIPTSVKMSPAMHRLTFSKPLSRHNAKSMVNTMDRNTKDSTSGKIGAIYEVSSNSNASDTCLIHPNAQWHGCAPTQ